VSLKPYIGDKTLRGYLAALAGADVDDRGAAVVTARQRHAAGVRERLRPGMYLHVDPGPLEMITARCR
jgi:hypothetical protein